MIDFKNKVAVVTGGGRDIGKHVSLELARYGASVAVNYRQSKKEAEATVRDIKDQGGNAVAIQADVTKAADIQAMVKKTQEALGKAIHILVNVTGGLVARKKMEEMDEAFWDEVMAINVKSAFLVCKAVLPVMADGGSIINFSSQAGRDGGGPGAIAYATAKGAILTFTRGLAKELGPRKIRVNAVSPGMINTTFHDTFTKPEVRQRVASMVPLGREGTAVEVARLVAFLASDAAPYVNGESVEINGGIFFS